VLFTRDETRGYTADLRADLARFPGETTHVEAMLTWSGDAMEPRGAHVAFLVNRGMFDLYYTRQD